MNDERDRTSSEARQDSRPAPVDEHALLAAARAAAEPVSPEVAARLAAMRREAVRLAEAGGDPAGWFARLLAPRHLAGLAAACSLVLALWIGLRPGDDVLPVPLLDGPEVAVVEDLELLEDLEFLAWLEEESVGAG